MPTDANSPNTEVGARGDEVDEVPAPRAHGRATARVLQSQGASSRPLDDGEDDAS
jgi:hypothetical protein